MSLNRAFTAFLAAVLLAGCGDGDAMQDITGVDPGARIKFFNFGVNAPGVNFYANEQKLTAVLSGTGQESTNGVAYGSAGNGALYSAIAPGQYTFAGKIAAATDKDLAVAALTAPITAGKSYSLYMSGFYDAAAKKSDAFIVEDNYPANVDFAAAYVRFVHAISNASPMTLYVKNTTTLTEAPVGSAVAYKAGGEFVTVPVGTYDLSTRVTGSSANAIVRTAVGFAAGRVYTITARGDITVTSTTATNRPFLDNTTNR